MAHSALHVFDRTRNHAYQLLSNLPHITTGRIKVTRTLYLALISITIILISFSYFDNPARSYITQQLHGNEGHSHGGLQGLSDEEIYRPLTELCERTEWTEGLYVHCHNGAGPDGTSFRGGLSNVRNRMQTCVRLAISAGAGVVVSLLLLLVHTL
jgi:hypothetical protein